MARREGSGRGATGSVVVARDGTALARERGGVRERRRGAADEGGRRVRESSAFDRCLVDAQRAFSGVRRYQLADAAAHLHAELRASVPLVRCWVPSPPPRARVDTALRSAGLEGEAELSRPQFGDFAAELFREAVLAGAVEAALVHSPAAAAGVVGVGVAARAAPTVVGRVVAVYAAGVAAVVYLSLG